MLLRLTLRQAALFFIVAWTVHTADHARRGLDATTDAVVWSGTVVGLLAAVALTLLFVRHPTSPAVAATVFPSIAVGVAASHLLPRWSLLSDPLLVDSSTDGWSIAAAGSEIIAAALLGALAFRTLAQHHYSFDIPVGTWQ